MSAALEMLVEKRYPAPEWAIVRELGNATGWAQKGRIDLAAVNCWPSKKHVRHAFEVKRTRSDFLRELRDPGKRQWVEKAFHETYFVVDRDVCTPEELPEKWGLLVANKKGTGLIAKRKAIHRDVPDWPPVAVTMLRATVTEVQAFRDRKLRFRGEDVTEEEIEALVEEKLAPHRKALEDARERLVTDRADLGLQRSALEAPLLALANRLGDGGYTARSAIRRRQVTEGIVDAWLDAARRQAAERLQNEAEMLQNALAEFVAKAKEDP